MRRFMLVAALTLSLFGAAQAQDAHADQACGHHKITHSEFTTAKVGWARWRTQRLFDNCGVRVVMWAGERGRRHIEKSYPTTDGHAVVIYSGPPSTHPFAGPMHLTRKEWA